MGVFPHAARAAAAWSFRALARCSRARLGVVLCYHGIADRAGNPAQELSAPLSLAEFERQLAHLKRHYDVVPASEIRAAVASRRRGRRFPVAITFDDDLPSHVTHAIPALAGAGLTATFFVAGVGLAGPFSYWWQLLQRAWEHDLLDAELRAALGVTELDISLRDIAAGIERMPRAERDAVAASLLAATGGERGSNTLSRSGLESLAAGHFDFGFHTRHHDDLVRLGDAELEDAMAVGRSELEAIVGPLQMMSYPHGRGDTRVAAAARAAGFRFAFLADGSLVTPADDPHLLGRRYPARGVGGEFELDLARILLAGARKRS